MRKVAIVGVGLIGASFGLALRKAGFAGPIIGVSSPAALAEGLKAGAISQTASLLDAVQQADLIYLSQPVDRIMQTLVEIGPVANSSSLITDAGSTKVEIVRTAAVHVKHAQFLGGHPMAGKEARGALAADADLFQGRRYVLEPAVGPKVDSFREWIGRIGSQIVEMTPEAHDATVALTSHLPQLLSTALAAFLATVTEPGIQQVFGSGLLDMTRLALSQADLWSSIIQTNPENVRHAIDGYVETLTNLRDSLGTDEFQRSFALSSDFARQLRKLPL